LGSKYYQNEEKSETNPLAGIRPKKRKPMIPKLSRIKRTAFCIILSDLSTTQFRLIFKDKGHKSDRDLNTTRVHTSNTRVQTSNIRVHTNNIRVTHEYIRITYE
jgi:hypothetical protein